jgi:hypothetical protein
VWVLRLLPVYIIVHGLNILFLLFFCFGGLGRPIQNSFCKGELVRHRAAHDEGFAYGEEQDAEIAGTRSFPLSLLWFPQGSVLLYVMPYCLAMAMTPTLD